jgi:hypothetical protein
MKICETQSTRLGAGTAGGSAGITSSGTGKIAGKLGQKTRKTHHQPFTEIERFKQHLNHVVPRRFYRLENGNGIFVLHEEGL